MCVPPSGPDGATRLWVGSRETRGGVLKQALNSRRGLWDYVCVCVCVCVCYHGRGVRGLEGIKGRVEGGD